MNPHKIFASVMLVSIAATVGGFVAGGDFSGLYGMAQTFGITLVCVAVVLFVTRKYWSNARRMA
ncbi:MAG: hypothetical protein HRF40_10560 [Nitrososphaera sp.]